jgi:8-oxo-dGTP pyrophosphatase MutT (NUDIX family)
MATPDDEILDLVNENDEVIGIIGRGEYGRMVEENLGFIRSVELLIRNSEGKYWIPIRTADKKIAPSGMDYSMGGHVDAGETYMQAALREIDEELNLQLNADDLLFVKKFAPDGIHYFRTLYVYESNDAPAYNPRDFVGAEWLSLAEIEQRVKSGVPAKHNLVKMVAAADRFMAARA